MLNMEGNQHYTVQLFWMSKFSLKVIRALLLLPLWESEWLFHLPLPLFMTQVSATPCRGHVLPSHEHSGLNHQAWYSNSFTPPRLGKRCSGKWTGELENYSNYKGESSQDSSYESSICSVASNGKITSVMGFPSYYPLEQQPYWVTFATGVVHLARVRNEFERWRG